MSDYCKCVACEKDLPHTAPKEVINDKTYCGECAFMNGLITEREYIKRHLYWISLDGLRAKVHDGEIHITAFNQRFCFEIKAQEHRKTREYHLWRSSVFERDGYKCQMCGQVGGTLNAHHIKEYAKYPELRCEVDNGVTLCESCHKKIHSKDGISNWQADKTK